MSYATRMRSIVRRGLFGAPDPPDRWHRYLEGVEPAVAAQPRVHRFAAPPLIGAPELESTPLAVWVEGDGERAQRSKVALQSSTQRPVTVLGGPLAQALQSTRSTHIALVRAGDVLAPLALERMGQAISLAPDASVLTSDDDALDLLGRRHSPRFRPGPSPDHWLAADDSGALLVVAREAALSTLSQLTGPQGWRHELALRLAGPDGTGHAHVPLLLCHRGFDVDGPSLATAAQLEGVLADWHPGARLELAPDVRRVRWGIAGEPTVEVIVCLRDRAELLARCASSLLHVTDYERLSLTLVDNGSTEPETLELLGRVQRDPRVRVIRDDGPFNFAALNNAAARASRAEVLVFLNNDTAIVDPNWVTTMLEEAMRERVGAVAPLLLYPDDTVQHAGAALGLHGYAGHPFAGLSASAQTPFGVAAGGTRNWLAVTAACMMVQAEKFWHVGGFDESFIVAGNDVDLCLRLTRAGLRSLCVPHATVIHDESRSRGAHIDPADFIRSEQSYGDFRTIGDPFYNPNLTLRSTRCEVRVPGEEAQ
jgi:O-antigen biosynthesis protein